MAAHAQERRARVRALYAAVRGVESARMPRQSTHAIRSRHGVEPADERRSAYVANDATRLRAFVIIMQLLMPRCPVKGPSPSPVERGAAARYGAPALRHRAAREARR